MEREEEVPPKRLKQDISHVAATKLPKSAFYEMSLMHRDTVTHILGVDDILITASADGFIKFWKCTPPSLFEETTSLNDAPPIIKFVRTFSAHSGPIISLQCSQDGSFLATVGEDGSLKIFDLANFDLVCMLKLNFKPVSGCWIRKRGDGDFVFLFLSRTEGLFAYSMEQGKISPWNVINLNEVSIVKSSNSNILQFSYQNQMLFFTTEQEEEESSTGGTTLNYFNLIDKSRGIINLNNSSPVNLTISKDESLLVVYCEDRHVRIYRLPSLKLYREYDESLSVYKSQYLKKKEKSASASPLNEDESFKIKMEMEKTINDGDLLKYNNCSFTMDNSILIFSSPFGIKLLDLRTNKLISTIGRSESIQLRFMSTTLCNASLTTSNISLDVLASDNPAANVLSTSTGSIIVATALKKNRFFLFSTRSITDQPADRDVLNEELPSDGRSNEGNNGKLSRGRLPSKAIIRTTLGDIHIDLYKDLTPKTVENFAGHSKAGYYDNVIFHRVIKGFMIQTGDPLGNGTGGESIWGGTFSDEFHPSLRHSAPFMVSMANCGKNTNGSQFFITTVKTPWLDDKHTLFGMATKGQDVVLHIEELETDKRDKPRKEVKIVQIDLIY